MAKKVIMVDDFTRVIIPETAWGYEVLGRLIMQGHTVKMTDQDPETLKRFEDEIDRMHQLLDSTGI